MDYQRPNHQPSSAEQAAQAHSEYRYLKLFATLTVLTVLIVAIYYGLRVSRSMQAPEPARHPAAKTSVAPTTSIATAPSQAASGSNNAPAASNANASNTPAAPAPAATATAAVSAPASKAFAPPAAEQIPEGPMGDMIRKGEQIFLHTGANAKGFVGNTLNCVNCHLDAGRLGNSAPLWGAYTQYPAYRAKTKSVDTFSERLRGCFMYSMNGKAPPDGHEILVALEAYAYWMSKGAPVGEKLPGASYPKVAKPAQAPDYARGETVYAAKCALCHGADGQGQRSGEVQVFPPLWGKQSYNWGAGMHEVDKATGFIKANMPLGLGNSLSDQEAWGVATCINSHERPQDPRVTGNVADTRKQFHDSEFSLYGQTVNGQLLGQGVK